MDTLTIGIIILAVALLLPFALFRLTRGEIRQSYLFDNGREFFLFQIIDSTTKAIEGGGTPVDLTRIKIRKVNLVNFKTEYIKKVVITGSSSLYRGGYPDFLGLTEKYIFLKLDSKDIFILRTDNGEIYAKRKDILQANKNKKDIEIQNTVFSQKEKSLILSDRQGQRYLLNSETLRMSALEDDGQKEKQAAEDYFSFEDLPSVELRKRNFDRYSDTYYFNETPNVRIKNMPGTDKVRINIVSKKTHTDYDHRKIKTFFLNPHILSSGSKKFPYVKAGMPVLMVLHAERYGVTAGNLLLSAVTGKSLVLFSHRLSEMFDLVYYGDENKLYYYEKDDHLIFFLIFGRRKASKTAVTVLNKFTGEIMEKHKI